ncbi:uncharacterized protein LOC131281772 [Anopheles ziemanni]|uniref:uncharacterized protein LOC131262118 n=1 Tax=Anopheles coustani TaxID=139045 RepID=UPI002658202B|nr:uncharacterized protein LOC131262118 [Anopheles coustani]XP_058167108.1 uncharacterized protein LOC131281772 [Anopheles ziemanni]
MNSKCRLCLCFVGQRPEFSATLKDEFFHEMLKTVFSFPLPFVNITAGKTFNLPVLVCFQCSTTVRNFYSFTKLTEASQNKLQLVCKGKNNSLPVGNAGIVTRDIHRLRKTLTSYMDPDATENNEGSMETENNGETMETHERSFIRGTTGGTGHNPSFYRANADEDNTKGTDVPAIDELLQYVKACPDDDIDTSDVNHDDEALLMSSYIEAESDSVSKEAETYEEHDTYSLNSNCRDDNRDNLPSGCVDKKEVDRKIYKVERRMNMMRDKIDRLLNSVGNSRYNSIKMMMRRPSFELAVITSEEELTSFNKQLEEKQYMEKVVDYLACNIDTADSLNRMHQAIDLIFDRVFFSKCNWSGRNKSGAKVIGISQFSGVLEVFRRIGTTNLVSVNRHNVQVFLIKKLHHAKDRVHMKRLRTSCHRTFQLH